MLAAGERGDPSLGGELIRSKAATTGRRMERRWRWWAEWKMYTQVRNNLLCTGNKLQAVKEGGASRQLLR